MLISWFRLTNLTLDLGSGRNPRKGGQNYTHCCLLAVNASLDIQNGFIVETLSSFIQSPIEDLLAATEANQFPYTAKWDGNPAGLMIPRRRKLAVWNKLFLPDLSQVMSWIIVPFAMLVAGVYVTIDTIMWLSICFAFSSPSTFSEPVAIKVATPITSKYK
ncbi:hypothetical protein DL95DRAFT_463504 [Leptodontidium sp. 2 PMI_412]|nr:hypothetical protein DL95DRAFT_463504 [Leptodontidium sp. 2 PMI_412]